MESEQKNDKEVEQPRDKLISDKISLKIREGYESGVKWLENGVVRR